MPHFEHFSDLFDIFMFVFEVKLFGNKGDLFVEVQRQSRFISRCVLGRFYLNLNIFAKQNNCWLVQGISV